MAVKIRVGIAGCGMIAKRSHIEGFSSLRGVEVSSLFDVDLSKAGKLRNSMLPDARVYDDFHEMLNSGIDAVSICAPTAFHYEQSMDALRKGLHVFCEKPMAVDLNKATRMVNASRQSGMVLHINQSLRYNPSYAAIGGLIGRGKIGDLLHMRCIRASSGNPAGPSGWSPGAGWFLSKKHGGGVLLDIGIHMADLFKWYGGEVSEAAGHAGNSGGGDAATDSVAAVFRFKSDATGVLELKWNLGSNANMLELYGTKGAVRFGFSEDGIEFIPGGRKGSGCEIIKPARKVKNSFASFVSAVRGVSVSPTPGELGRDALALCEAVRKSSKSKKFEKVKKWKN